MAAIGAKEFRVPDPFSEMGEPDNLLPSQFADRIVTALSSQPEKRLMLAVLQDAIAIYQTCWLSGKRREKRLFREAEEWITANDTAWPFSFVNICNALNFDADCLRKGLADWQARQMALRVRKANLVTFPVKHIPKRQENISKRAEAPSKSVSNEQNSAGGNQSEPDNEWRRTFSMGRM